MRSVCLVEKVQRAFSTLEQRDNAVETKTSYFIFCFDDATSLQLLANPPPPTLQ